MGSLPFGLRLEVSSGFCATCADGRPRLAGLLLQRPIRLVAAVVSTSQGLGRMRRFPDHGGLDPRCGALAIPPLISPTASQSSLDFPVAYKRRAELMS